MALCSNISGCGCRDCSGIDVGNLNLASQHHLMVHTDATVWCGHSQAELLQV